MKIKIFGKTDIPVFTVGIGTGTLGVRKKHIGLVYTGKPELMDIGLGAETLGIALGELIENAKQQGHRPGDAYFIIDTAAFYGERRSEMTIGQVLRNYSEFRPWVLVTTKVGQTYTRGSASVSRIDYSHLSLLDSLKHSQGLIGTELPIVYLHDPMGLSKNVVLDAQRSLLDAGAASFVGVAANDPDTTETLLATGQFPIAVVPEAVSLINKRGEKGIIPMATNFGIELIAATVIEKGLLTDSATQALYRERHFSPECLSHVAKLRKVCQQSGITLGSAAVQWPAYHYHPVACSLIGISTPEDARALANTASLEIPESAWKQIEPLVQHFPGQRDIWTPKKF